MSISAAKLMIEVGADTKSAERDLRGVQGTLDSVGKSATATGLKLSAGITTPLLAVGAGAITVAAELQQTMSILQQVIGASESEMASLNKEALRLGAVTSFSAGEAGDAMLELGKAGMNTQQIIASISGVLDLAAAGGVGLATAANVTASALNAFNLSADQSGYVANLLAAAANASAAEISDLAQGLQQGGFAFSAAGQDIDDLAASLAILTNVGLTGSDAGTALKNAFTRMMSPTKEARSLMEELNISFFDAQGNMKQMPEIIGMLNESMSGMTQEQRLAALETIFLSDGMKAFIPLLEAGTEGFNAMLEAVNKEGAAAEVAEARMDGLRGAIEYFAGSVESFLIGQGTPFLDLLSDWIRKGADFITSLDEMDPALKNAALAFGGVLAAAGPVLLTIGGVASALAFLMTPIGLIIVGTALLAAAWAANFGGIRDKTAEVYEAVKPKLEDLKVGILGVKGAFGLLWSGLTGIGDYEGVMKNLGLTINAFGPDAAGRIEQVALKLGGWRLEMEAIGRLKLAEMSTNISAVGDAIRLLRSGWSSEDGANLGDMLFYWGRVEDVFGKETADLIFRAADGLGSFRGAVTKAAESGISTLTANIRGLWDALNLLWSGLTDQDGSNLSDKLFFWSKLVGVFGQENADKIYEFANKLGDLRTRLGAFTEESIASFGTFVSNVEILVSTGDLGPLAEQLSSIKGSLTDFGTEKLAEFRDLLNEIKTGLFFGAVGLSMTMENVDVKEFVGSIFGPIKESLDSLDFAGAAGNVNTFIGSLTSGAQQMGALRVDVLSATMEGIVGVIESLAGAAISFLTSVDASRVGNLAGQIVISIADAISGTFTSESSERIGRAFGGLSRTIIEKIAEALGTPELGSRVGEATGEAAGAFVVAAESMVYGFADELAKTNWGIVKTQMQSFVSDFVAAFWEAFQEEMFNFADKRVQEGIERGLQPDPNDPVSSIPNIDLTKEPPGWMKWLGGLFGGMNPRPPSDTYGPNQGGPNPEGNFWPDYPPFQLEEDFSWPSLEEGGALEGFSWPSLEEGGAMAGFVWPPIEVPMPDWIPSFFDKADQATAAAARLASAPRGGGSDDGGSWDGDDGTDGIPDLDPYTPWDGQGGAAAMAAGGVVMYNTIYNPLDIEELALKVEEVLRRRR